MVRNYKELTDSIKGRLNPENIILEKRFRDELGTISYNDTLVFIRTAMKGVEPEYTQRSKDAGERVKEHLNKVLNDKTYKYQGSVMTNTHIKGVSDIDLLVISDKFYRHDVSNIKQILENSVRRSNYGQSTISKLESEVNCSSYKGNSLEDLRNLRLDSEKQLSSVYSVCDVKKPKAIKIKNLSLNREVDIVVAN